MLEKKYLKTKKCWKVTFYLPQEIKAEKVAVAGEFNNWNIEANPLKKVKNVWKTSVELEPDQTFQFRYVVNGTEWYNDDGADQYVPNFVDGDNSVVVTALN